MGICGRATAYSGDCAIRKLNMTYKSVKSRKIYWNPCFERFCMYNGGGGEALWEKSSYDRVVNIVNCVKNVSTSFVI